MIDKKRTASLDWEDVRYFVALARHGSLSATSRALRVNHATVSRRVAGLEARLGRALFDRRAAGYVLTAAGRAVLDEAEAMDTAAAAVLRRLEFSTDLNGLVRLTTARSLAEGFLIDRLDRLHARHPAIDLELIAEARVMSLARREADLALRFGSPKDSELVARRLGTIAYGLYVSAACADKANAARALPLIGFDQDSHFIAESAWLSRHFGDRRMAFRSSSQAVQSAAARAGYGIALLPRYLAARDPRLAQVTPGMELLKRELWLLMPRELTRVPRIRAVADYLIELFGKERRLLGG
jgi:DNA-binding transcriptional LysR family regulator